MIDCNDDCRGCEQCVDTSEDPEAGCPSCGAHEFNRDCAVCMEEYASMMRDAERAAGWDATP